MLIEISTKEEKVEKISINNLSNRQIAFVLLRRLSSLISAGGMSLGRSIQSIIISAVFQEKVFVFGERELDELDIVEEVLSREQVISHAENMVCSQLNTQVQLVFEFAKQTTHLSSITMIRCLLEKLVNYYRDGQIEWMGEIRKSPYGYEPICQERSYAILVDKLWDYSEDVDPPTFSLDELLVESDERFHRRFYELGKKYIVFE